MQEAESPVGVPKESVGSKEWREAGGGRMLPAGPSIPSPSQAQGNSFSCLLRHQL